MKMFGRFGLQDQMKLNEHTYIFGDKTVLVPYQRKHVPRYSCILFYTIFEHQQIVNCYSVSVLLHLLI